MLQIDWVVWTKVVGAVAVAEDPSGPFVPASPEADTLSAAEPARLSQLRRDVLPSSKPKDVSEVILADTSSAAVNLDTKPQGFVETFSMAEARTGDRDNRFSMAVQNPPRAVSTGPAPESAVTSFAAVSTGQSSDTGGAYSNRKSDDLVRRIEGLRENFRNQLDIEGPTPASSPADSVQDSVDSSVSPPEGEITETFPERARPFSFARPRNLPASRVAPSFTRPMGISGRS